uniref:Uncharacterized protein n=1 Tax=Romanomermis culicivorax TaxID=13658 RepID=A0A915KP87_ROMCU
MYLITLSPSIPNLSNQRNVRHSNVFNRKNAVPQFLQVEPKKIFFADLAFNESQKVLGMISRIISYRTE